ncbi:RHS repeat domain-containing protein [Butyrivibrio sp. INlla21]|uniref:RHS repeat domain-containing protein n=1 Tax=Butyrivibrio sp. INlla21 TaxID=1520811 RepID=UPI0008EBF3F9|nr:RHS repeat-associated core domain-containing protein [Butyrivibrio sp. INlla21]SFV03680.1 RHS repeat-associated core domain-containing protein [Butyrivibrio sp. INlla21]
MLSKVVDTTKGEITNQYNGLGFRVASTRPEERIEYLCDLSREYYNLLERTVNGEKESFVYDNNVISMSKSGINYYYLQDELGSPMYMTGTDGVVSSYAFDDFGRNIDPFTGKQKKKAYTSHGNIIQPFVFTGYQEDDISGLNFAQARYYSPEAGRFQSEDNIKGFVENPFTLNHYGYCWGNPIVLIDLDGNMPKWLEGIYAHLAIEADMKARYSSATNDVQTNVFIKGGGIDRTITGNGYADVVMKSGGIYSVYEIKPQTQDPGDISINTPGKEQLNGYVEGINANIIAGNTIGKYNSTNRGERAFEGTTIIPGNTAIISRLGDAPVTYYTNGDGMIYYEVGKTKLEQKAEAFVKEVNEVKENTLRSLARGIQSMTHGSGKIERRIARGVVGVGEIITGGLCITGSGVMFIDDGTVVGIANDPVAVTIGISGFGLIFDGCRNIVGAIFGCDG